MGGGGIKVHKERSFGKHGRVRLNETLKKSSIILFFSIKYLPLFKYFLSLDSLKLTKSSYVECTFENSHFIKVVKPHDTILNTCGDPTAMKLDTCSGLYP